MLFIRIITCKSYDHRTEIMYALQQYLYLNIYIHKHYCNTMQLREHIGCGLRDKKYNNNPYACAFSYRMNCLRREFNINNS